MVQSERSRGWAVWAMVVACVYSGGWAEADAGEDRVASERPNILFITSDDHRWDALGAAGNPAVHTPHLDRLARQGIYFPQATTSVSQCLPVRASLLTGLLSHQHGAYAHQNQAPRARRPDSFSDLPTVPSLLRGQGYETVLVGKWHLASDPWKVGFSQTRVWLPTGGEKFKGARLCHGESRERKLVAGFTQEVFADSAIDFLTGEQAQKGPFMLWLAFTAPHGPFAPNPPHIEALYAAKTIAELLPAGFPTDVEMNDWLHYYEAVSALDEQVGRVLAALDEAGLAESTVVVFFGDNGFMMGERGIGSRGAAGKVVPYEGSLRVPLIVRAPSQAGFQGTSQAALSGLDLPPTMVALSGAEIPTHWPGRNALPALRQPRVEGFSEAFAEWSDEATERFLPWVFRAVRTPRHKLILFRDEARGRELYNLEADPREGDNLIRDPAHRATAERLEKQLRAWMEQHDDPALAWPVLADEGSAVAGP
ncbi:MAG: sulfatase-like hydrolase/transferase [Acidobacteriota bacterium]